MKMLKAKSLFILLSIGLFFYSCVEPYDLGQRLGNKILTVESTITDLAGEQSVKLTESISTEDLVYSLPITKAKVEIVVNGTERVTLTEKTAGVYILPISFHAQVGNTYQLVFQKSDGKQYQSNIERLVRIPAIKKLYDEFKTDGISTINGNYPGNYIYLDTDDPANEQNFYMWSWKLWERQAICATCTGGRYFTTPTPGCRSEVNYSEVIYDYACKGACWDIFYNPDLNVFSDIFTNGKPLIGRLVAKIPYYSANGALVEIKQQSISSDAYKYLKLLAEQVQSNGSLVDTPPAAIVGNVKNMNDSDEPVAGFFMVTSVVTQRYWLGRENGEGKASPIGLLGHPVNYEPMGADISRPPMVTCDESKTRTPTKPEGWLN
ncbi:DUF4249 domain-containing protein [Emticicia sp. 17c]|uniref:DUF4249 domain-containing protein n=1 Tax=Emticicia sp. 17c TaxID=3127704 RepID=UPI00301DCF7A